MQKITYFQAAGILGVKQDTIKNAVFYDRLTRCVSPTKEAMLLKEQVELFKGKRISPKALSVEEEALWKEYKRIAENSELLELATKEAQVNESASVLVAKEIAKLRHEEKMEKISNIVSELYKAINEEEYLEPYPQMPLALK